jgi:N-acyl-D-aspartate/D-glutamate deacylase
MEFDLVIRGGEVFDGTGEASRTADVGIKDGTITEVGVISRTAVEEIDARGKVVCPGFVDIHTHYDGQAVWDDQLTPSSWHGVTTVLMGNCGVGFAPCRPNDRDELIELMEGVEDIPAPVMHEGLTWTWESFPEYLDSLETKTRDVDVCALVPHAPVRVYVMGKRAIRLEPAEASDVTQMREIVATAIEAGAFGVSTSRTTVHHSLSGDLMPTTLAREREIIGLAMGMADAGRGFLEVINELSDPDAIGEYQMILRALQRSGRPGVFSLTQQHLPAVRDMWRDVIKVADDAIADGVTMRAVVAPRAIGVHLGLQGSQNPFTGTATYHAIAGLPLAERVERMKDPGFRARVLADDPAEFRTRKSFARIEYSKMFCLGDPPNYTPAMGDSVESIARRHKKSTPEVAYDLLIENDGKGFLYVPFSNYADGDLRACEEMLANPNTIMGLSDGGAHVGYIIDASFPTWLLTYWVKQRGVMSLQEAIRRLTSDTADMIGLADRGRLRPGLRADVNIVDFDRIGCEAPYAAHDLPEGGMRLLQRATGYDVTIVAGEVTYLAGEATDARPGKLVRSGRYTAT